MPMRFVLILVSLLLSTNILALSPSSSQLDALLSSCTDDQSVPGVVALVGNRDEVLYQGAAGQLSMGDDAPMAVDSVFVIASMTKPVTSLAVLQLVEHGKVSLDASLADYLPRFANAQVLEGFDANGQARFRPANGPVTIRQLLTHTSGYVYPVWNEDAARAAQKGLVPDMMTPGGAWLDAPLAFDPGTAWEYGISTDLLGEVIASVSGQTLPAYMQQHILQPLGMNDTFFAVPDNKLDRQAGLHLRLEDGSLMPIPPQAPDPTFFSGGGGLYSTASDYLRFLRTILRGGELDGVRILSEDLTDAMTRNQIGDLRIKGPVTTFMPQFSNSFDLTLGAEATFGFGFLINSQAQPGGRAANSLSWAGLYNSYFWIDPGSDLIGILMTQVLPFWDGQVLRLLGAFENAAYRHFGPRAAVQQSSKPEQTWQQSKVVCAPGPGADTGRIQGN